MSTEPKTHKPRHGSGKTAFNRMKKPGEDWTALRAKAIKDKRFQLPEELQNK